MYFAQSVQNGNKKISHDSTISVFCVDRIAHFVLDYTINNTQDAK